MAKTEPGFYQADPSGLVGGEVGGPRLRGRATGRAAPRDHVRQPAHERVLQDHDLLPKHVSQVGSNRNFDANQGQLFDPQKIAPRSTRTDVAVARDYGVTTGEVSIKGGAPTNQMLGQPGFLPSLGQVAGSTGKERAQAVRSKKQAIQNVGKTSTGATFAGMMESRAQAGAGAEHQTWYMGKDSSGRMARDVQGDAATKVQEAAARTGTSSAGMTRTVAMTSPQMAWHSRGGSAVKGVSGRDHMEADAGVFPNILAAEHITRDVKAHVDREPDASREDLHKTAMAVSPTVTSTSVKRPGGERQDFRTNVRANPTPDSARKVSEHVATEHRTGRATSSPFPIQGPLSLKTPNFEASLQLSHIDPAVQRIAATSYTVDRHDAALVGIDSNSPDFKKRGMIESIGMTGRRDALKAGSLPPNRQADLWEAHRSGKGLGGGNQMFTETGQVRPDLANNKPASRTMQRSSQRGGVRNIADDLGLEF